MFADSFRLVSIHCVARGLGASFLYNCPASHGSSLRQHGLLVDPGTGTVTDLLNIKREGNILQDALHPSYVLYRAAHSRSF